MSIATPTNKECYFHENDVIVSKTDTKGRILYVNKVFMDISGFVEEDLLGQPHSMIRHPTMPRCVFKLFWEKLEEQKEIFAYVKNMCKNGDHYWVLAHVTPSRDKDENVVGYHSNRRVPDAKVIKEIITPLYQHLSEIEQGHSNRKEGMLAAYDEMMKIIKEKEAGYERFIFSLQG